MNIKLDGNQAFDMYKARFTNLVHKLKEMGEKVSPAIQRYVILKGLPASYDSLIQSLKVNDKLTLEEVCIHIKDCYECDKLHPRDYSVVDLNAGPDKVGFTGLSYANYIAKYRGNKVKPRHDDTCHTCGNPGHYARDCAMAKGFKVPTLGHGEGDAQKEEYSHFFA
jgi:hypothetical protein